MVLWLDTLTRCISNPSSSRTLLTLTEFKIQMLAMNYIKNRHPSVKVQNLQRYQVQRMSSHRDGPSLIFLEEAL